ncbi:MAG: hypothetical protein K1X44_07895, partial [Alphaproteobacteria bacterium]|nr:hypothetical protein [Alphaproteobacteria bacterium]
CQEEPKNMGAWGFVAPLIEELMAKLKMKQDKLIYIGRPAAAAPATGLWKRHVLEQNLIVQSALSLEGQKK